ncbi:hypothetical protein FQA39_LY02198 [Lamprigera yunnana]|nr:hypothetical protein FQA39_LY02198 [Lamprigera yunnana]
MNLVKKLRHPPSTTSGPSTSTAVEDFLDFDNQEEVELGVSSESEIDKEDEEDVDKGNMAQENLSIGEFIKVQFETNKDEKFYVGKIQNLKDVEVEFLCPIEKTRFVLFLVINLSQIVRKLPISTILRCGGYELLVHLKLKAYYL